MKTPTIIPKKLSQEGDLVVIPRKEYEELIRRPRAKRKMTALDKSLQEAIDEYRRGESYGPFNTAKEAIAFLDSRRGSKGKKK